MPPASAARFYALRRHAIRTLRNRHCRSVCASTAGHRKQGSSISPRAFLALRRADASATLCGPPGTRTAPAMNQELGSLTGLLRRLLGASSSNRAALPGRPFLCRDNRHDPPTPGLAGAGARLMPPSRGEGNRLSDLHHRIHAVAFARWCDTVEMNARRRSRRRRSRWYPIQRSRLGGRLGSSSLRIPWI